MRERDYSKAAGIIAGTVEKVGGKKLTQAQHLALAGSLALMLKREFDAGRASMATSTTDHVALRLLDDIIVDLDMRARANGDVEDGKAVLDVSSGLVRRYYDLKADCAARAIMTTSTAALVTPDHDDSPCGQCGAAGAHLCAASAVTPTASTAEPIPDQLFDGYAVLQALSEKAKSRTNADNVADVLDAVVSVIRAERATPHSPVTGEHSTSKTAQMLCQACGVDRFKEDCKGDRINCPILGTALSGEHSTVPDSSEREGK